MNSLIALEICYSLSLFIYVVFLIFYIIQNHKFSAFFIVECMYTIIYGLVPLLTFYNIRQNGLDYYTRTIDLSENGLSNSILIWTLSLVGFLLMNLGYRIRCKSIKSNNLPFKAVSHRSLYISSIIMTIISLFSLFLWTYPFGGPIAMFEYGTWIRSGYEIDGISNSFGFMKHFVPLGMFSSVISLALFIDGKRIKYLLHFFVGLTISIVYLIANDGRAPFLMYLVSLAALVLLMRNKKAKESKIRLLPLLFIGVLGVAFIENIDSIIALIEGKTISSTSSSEGSSILDFFYSEFSWTVRNAQAVFVARENGVGFRIFDDLISAVFSLVPSKLTPTWVKRLEIINTTFWFNGVTGYGGKPTDIIVTGYYQFGAIGALSLPLFYGVVLKKIDDYFNNENNNALYQKILFVQLIYHFAKTIAYADFALVTLNLFYILIAMLIVKMVSTSINRKRVISYAS